MCISKKEITKKNLLFPVSNICIKIELPLHFIEHLIVIIIIVIEFQSSGITLAVHTGPKTTQSTIRSSFELIFYFFVSSV